MIFQGGDMPDKVPECWPKLARMRAVKADDTAGFGRRARARRRFVDSAAKRRQWICPDMLWADKVCRDSEAAHSRRRKSGAGERGVRGDVLDLYHEEYDPERPVVCFDEPPSSCSGMCGLPSGRYDTEYQRNGTRNLFMFCERRVAGGASR